MMRAMLARAGAWLGPLGSIGAALLVLAAGFYAGTLAPETRRLEALEREVADARQARRAARETPRTPARELAAFYAYFPAADELPEILQAVYHAAQRQDLALERGEYKVTRPGAGGMFEYQLSFPVKGTYPQLRKFLQRALAEVPALGLESVQLERQKVGDTVLNAKITLAVHLGRR
jgi:hypothetical protein